MRQRKNEKQHRLWRAAILSAPAIVLISLPSSALYAQTAEQSAAQTSLEPKSENGRLIYDAALFKRFAPLTASDMVRQLPGFSVSDVSSDRGLGEASQNVLINGARISGKSNDAKVILTRIAADSVIRLELVDGASLNISGLSGQVLNVVTKATGLKGNFSWRPQIREQIPVNPFGGDINISGTIGKGNFTLGLANIDNAYRGGGFGQKIASDSNGNLLFIRDYASHHSGDAPTLSASYSVTSKAGAIFNVNGSFGLGRYRDNTEWMRLSPTEAPIHEVAKAHENDWNYELSGDYDFALGPGRLKLIGYQHRNHVPSSNQFSSDYTDGSAPTASRFDQNVDSGETIGRAEYKWKTGKSDWQISFEGAKNYLDVQSSYSVLDNLGVFQNVPLPGANARVQENRAQILLSYGRPIANGLTLQASLGGEYSQLEQSGSNGLKRAFWRPKGSLSLAWKADKNLDISARLQRKVGQLNFGDFLQSVDLVNSNNNAGNPELVPPQSWLAELELNRSLGKMGSIKWKMSAEKISDLVDQIPITATTEAPGNLPSARIFSTSVNATFLFDTVGWHGAKLDVKGIAQRSFVNDPLTGIERPISNDTRFSYEITLRHDIPKSNWSYGGSIENNSNAPFFRLNYFSSQSNSAPLAKLFVENKNMFGLKLRFVVANPLLDRHENSHEIFYIDRHDGPIRRFEDDSTPINLVARLTISGTF